MIMPTVSTLARVAVYVVLVWAAVASGAWRYWLVGSCFLLVGSGVAAWLTSQLIQRQVTWKRTALDLPVLLLGVLIGVQLLLGNRTLVAWALGPARPITEFAPDFPAPFLAVGSVLPRQTLESALIFAGYLAVYYLVVHAFPSRAHLERLIRALVLLGTTLAFVGLLEYMTGQRWLTAWLPTWRDYEDSHRLTSTWANPDHFGAWLAMLILLTLGWLVARSGGRRRPSGVGVILRTRELREDLFRRYLPMFAAVVMGLAMVFTLSRGAVIGLATGLLVFLLLLGATGRAKRSGVLAGVLLVAMGAYGAWIGFGPLIERFASARDSTLERGLMYLAALPMLRDFPLLGVGLGGFREIYFRYQPAVHQAGIVYFPYAHNDLLQLVLELGAVGTVLCLFFGARFGLDLVGAHLVGRWTCPVSSSPGNEAPRHERWSVGVSIGALAGIAALIAHSFFDFSARIPANGFLVSALLGIATVALHTRFGENEQLLSAERRFALDRAPRLIAAAAIALILVAAWTLYWARAAIRSTLEVRVLYEDSLSERRQLAERLLALDPWSPRGLNARAYDNYQAALAAWYAPPSNPDTRRAKASALLGEARRDLRAALTVAPTNPFLHSSLAWVEATDATINDRQGVIGLAPALTHALRAVALASDNAGMYESVARIAYSIPPVGLRAAQETVRRDPSRLATVVDLYLPLGLTDAEWLAMVPKTGVARLELATLLEERRVSNAALSVFQAARDVAPTADEPLYRWALATALQRRGQIDAAISELERALEIDPSNPELLRSLGESLARRGDSTALQHFRRAIAVIEQPAHTATKSPFVTHDARLAAWLQRHVGDDLVPSARYRRALAHHLLEHRLWDEAVVEWQHLARELPRDGGVHYGLGLALEGTGRPDRALEEFRAAVKLSPGDIRFRDRLAQRLWDSEQYYQAITEWQAVREQAPRYVPARLALARAYERIGQRADAYKEYRAILALEANQADATRALARLDSLQPR